jgi:hypothetical protein
MNQASNLHFDNTHAMSLFKGKNKVKGLPEGVYIFFAIVSLVMIPLSVWLFYKIDSRNRSFINLMIYASPAAFAFLSCIENLQGQGAINIVNLGWIVALRQVVFLFTLYGLLTKRFSIQQMLVGEEGNKKNLVDHIDRDKLRKIYWVGLAFVVTGGAIGAWSASQSFIVLLGYFVIAALLLLWINRTVLSK